MFVCLFVVVVVSVTSGDLSKNMLLQLMPEKLLPVLSSRIFMVSGLTFRSSIHFEFIFVYGVRQWSSFILFCSSPVSQHHLLKRLSFLIVYSCLLCHRLIDHIRMDLFVGCLSCYINLCVCFCAHTILF